LHNSQAANIPPHSGRLSCKLPNACRPKLKIIPHSLAAAMLAGILLRFGLQAFGSLQDNLPLCGGMFAAPPPALPPPANAE
jgi:hypothetical protein